MTTREKAILWLNSFVKNKEPMTLIPKQLIRLMHEALAEQPEIVRCRDCKHRDPEDKKCDCGHDIHWQLPRRDDWFCADGERKESGEV